MRKPGVTFAVCLGLLGTPSAGAVGVSHASSHVTSPTMSPAASPATSRGAATSDTLRSAEWIEFELYRDSRIFIPLTINGYETVGILDSGAASTTIDAALARAAGIEGSGSFQATGTGGSIDVQVASGITMSVGDTELRGLRVVIADLSDVADRLLGRPLPVIVGAEWFDRKIVDIDFPNRRLAFREPGEWTYRGDGETVELIPNGRGRVVEIQIEGGEPIRAGFDIGQGSALTVLKPHADATNLLAGRQSGTVLAGGVGGASTERLITIDNLEFGGFRFERVPTVVPTVALGVFNTNRIQANLGTGIYGRFRMIVDFPRNRVILEPTPGTTTRPFARNRAGLQFERTERGVEISHVSEGSPAAAAGMEVGSVVTTIGGRRVGEDYWTGDLWRWTNAAAGSVVAVTVASGRTYSLTLRDYY